MRMIFNDDVLFVDVEGDIGNIELNTLKNRLFSVLDQYEVENIVVNVKNVFDTNKKNIKSFVREYSKKYNGHISICE